MAELCSLEGCTQPTLPPTFWRDETVPFVSGRSGQAKGGLGLCEQHDQQMTALVRHRRQVCKLYNSQPDPSVVYFIHGTRSGPYSGLIKIGTTDKLNLRRSQLGGKLLATELGGRQREGQLHARFWSQWVTGEWYRPSLELIAYIQSQQQEENDDPRGDDGPYSYIADAYMRRP